jgi:predicted Zn-dependent peptidase
MKPEARSKVRASLASEPRDRSAPAKRRARERVGESRGEAPRLILVLRLHGPTTIMDIPFTHHRLDNGLDVIVHEDRGCPIVAVNVWYHVGSKNEKPGRTGFAHLFEHLMFEGSQHYDQGYFRPLQEAGGVLNGSTNADRTNYWEVVPANAVELALWMESDRMGYLLPALTAAKFENQRNVVLNEPVSARSPVSLDDDRRR